MCGIAGIYNFDRSDAVDERLLETMTSTLAHRGPNGQGIFLDGNVGLGHRRLSVIDLEMGAQPMTDPVNRRTIVYNGEFFNYQEVRQSLVSKGVSFRTRSDTEVLLSIADSDVKQWIRRVNGMFAFAVWDAVARELMIVRDRFGVKPLYYACTPRGVAFASEIKALLPMMEDGPRLDRATLPEFLAFRHVLEPRTMFEGVMQLPSGHLMRLGPNDRSPRIERYWDESAELDASYGVSSAKDFQSVFSKAVGYRLVSDVPLGSFNSGGVDSSLITREVRRKVAGELHTFSVGFSETEFDETKYSQEVAACLGTTHHAESISPERYRRLLPTAIWHNDEPLCHPHSVHLMHLSEVAKQHVTVVLTGEGADEVFFGYPRLHISRIGTRLDLVRRLLGRVTTQAARVAGSRRLAKLGDAMSGRYPVAVESHRFVGLDVLGSLVGERDYAGTRVETLSRADSGQSLVEVLLEYERNSYMKSLVNRLDKMTMAHGLEARTPFLDFELVLWSKHLRAADKIGLGFENKSVLKSLASEAFSRKLVYRRKVGFDVPISRWFREKDEFRELLGEMLSPNSFVRSLFDHRVVDALVRGHASGRSDHGESLWLLANLEIWAQACSVT